MIVMILRLKKKGTEMALIKFPECGKLLYICVS